MKVLEFKPITQSKIIFTDPQESANVINSYLAKYPELTTVRFETADREYIKGLQTPEDVENIKKTLAAVNFQVCPKLTEVIVDCYNRLPYLTGFHFVTCAQLGFHPKEENPIRIENATHIAFRYMPFPETSEEKEKAIIEMLEKLGNNFQTLILSGLDRYHIFPESLLEKGFRPFFQKHISTMKAVLFDLTEIEPTDSHRKFMELCDEFWPNYQEKKWKNNWKDHWCKPVAQRVWRLYGSDKVLDNLMDDGVTELYPNSRKSPIWLQSLLP